MAGISGFALFSFLLAASVQGDQSQDNRILPKEIPPHKAGDWQILTQEVLSQQAGVRSCPYPFLTDEKPSPRQIVDPVCPESEYPRPRTISSC